LAHLFGLRLLTHDPLQPAGSRLEGAMALVAQLLGTNRSCDACEHDAPTVAPLSYPALPHFPLPLRCRSPLRALDEVIVAHSAYDAKHAAIDLNRLVRERPAYFIYNFDQVAAFVAKHKAGSPQGGIFVYDGLGCKITQHAPPIAQMLRARWTNQQTPHILRGARHVPHQQLLMAMHVRRTDSPRWRWISTSLLLAILRRVHRLLRTSPTTLSATALEVHIYSDAAQSQLQSEFGAAVLPLGAIPPGINLHLHGQTRAGRSDTARLLDDWRLFTEADILVTSLSSYAYYAALFSRGIKLSVDFAFPTEHLGCVVHVARWNLYSDAKACTEGLWHSGFIPSAHEPSAVEEPFSREAFESALRKLEAGTCIALQDGTHSGDANATPTRHSRRTERASMDAPMDVLPNRLSLAQMDIGHGRSCPKPSQLLSKAFSSRNKHNARP